MLLDLCVLLCTAQCVPTNDTDSACYNFDVLEPVFIIFATNVAC